MGCAPGSVAFDLAACGHGDMRHLAVEHTSGEMTVVARLDDTGGVAGTAILRTLMDGEVFL